MKAITPQQAQSLLKELIPDDFINLVNSLLIEGLVNDGTSTIQKRTLFDKCPHDDPKRNMWISQFPTLYMNAGWIVKDRKTYWEFTPMQN